MQTSTLTQKGQVTIPADLRHALGLHPGDILNFHKQSNKIIITKQNKDIIFKLLNELLENKIFLIQRQDLFEAALRFFENSSVGFSDCLILAESNTNGNTYLYTFDKKLAKLDGAKELKY